MLCFDSGFCVESQHLLLGFSLFYFALIKKMPLLLKKGIAYRVVCVLYGSIIYFYLSYCLFVFTHTNINIWLRFLWMGCASKFLCLYVSCKFVFGSYRYSDNYQQRTSTCIMYMYIHVCKHLI